MTSIHNHPCVHALFPLFVYTHKNRETTAGLEPALVLTNPINFTHESYLVKAGDLLTLQRGT